MTQKQQDELVQQKKSGMNWNNNSNRTANNKWTSVNWSSRN